MKKLNLKGIIPAVLTPYDSKHQIDEQSLRHYIDFLIANRVHGLFIAGTNGEGPLLKMNEKKDLIRIVIEQTARRIPVIAQTGGISTEETVELTEYAQEAGVDAVGIVAPWFFPHDNESLFTHFGTVAERVPDLPIYLYNIPSNAKNDIKPVLVKKLADHYPNIQGVKDSSKDLDRLCEYLDLMGKDFTVVIGTDSMVVPAMFMGATGVVSAVGDVFPEIMVQMYEAFMAGQYQEAIRLQFLVINIRKALKIGPYITPYKAALGLRGIPFAGIKPPFRLPTEEEVGAMKLELERLGVLK